MVSIFSYCIAKLSIEGVKTIKYQVSQIKGISTYFWNIYTDNKIIELQTRLDVISSVPGEFENVQSEIEYLIDNSETYAEERESFEN